MKMDLRNFLLKITQMIIWKYDKKCVQTMFTMNRFHDGIWEFKYEGKWKRYHYEDLYTPDLVDELNTLIDCLNNTDKDFDLKEIIKGVVNIGKIRND